MQPLVIVLNGPAGAGKSTAASRLAARLTGAVCISGDVLRRFAPEDRALARSILGPGSTYRVGGDLAAAYCTMGAATVIFDYVFETPAHIEQFRQRVAGCASVHTLTLWASPLTLEARRASRTVVAHQPVSFDRSWAAMEPYLPELGHAIATDDLDADGVCDAICEYLIRARALPVEAVAPPL